MKPWIITAAILIIAIVLGLWQLKPVQVIEADADADGAIQNTNSANGMQASAKGASANAIGNSSGPLAVPIPSATPAKKLTGNPHLDQLSPEMKQAIRDKLLLNGPMEAVNHPDGSIELPANGRFTQMPVAVQMPDGTIQIKEYTVIPE